jgi:class 3 adenylate cyclase
VYVDSRRRSNVSNAQIAVIRVFHDRLPSKRFAVGETRKIAAILVADVVGYSRLAGTDEDRTLARLRALRGDLIDPTTPCITAVPSS